MKILKNVLGASLIALTVTSAFADKIIITPSKSTSQEIGNWKFVTQDDGMFFILGEYTQKLLEIHTNRTVAGGVVADPVTIVCNAKNENVFRAHRIEPGLSLTCKGNYHDVVSMYIEPRDFKNGAEGTYEFKPITN